MMLYKYVNDTARDGRVLLGLCTEISGIEQTLCTAYNEIKVPHTLQLLNPFIEDHLVTEQVIGCPVVQREYTHFYPESCKGLQLLLLLSADMTQLKKISVFLFSS